MKKVVGLLVAIISLFCVSSALAADYTWPCSITYGVSNSYGHNGHIGTDFGTPIGSEVYAIAAGTVVSPTKDIGCTGSHNGPNYAPVCTTPGCTGSYANYIVIEHDNNTYSLYAHLKTGSFRVSVGQRVEQGQVIALSGNAGNTYGAHLHLELMIGAYRPNNTAYSKDPMNYLTKINVTPGNTNTPVPNDDIRMMYVLDTIETVGQQLHLAGWVYDKQNTDAQVTLHVYPGEGVQGFSTTGHRPEVNAAYGIDGLHGFDVYIQTNLVGPYEVSLYALHTDGSGAVLMTQRTVIYTNDSQTTPPPPVTPTPTPNIPVTPPPDDIRMMYVLDTFETVGQQLHLAGWVYDKQNTGAQVTLHVYPGEGVQGFSTTGHRPEVNAAYGIDGLHGFDVYIQTNLVGPYEVSLYALHTDGSGAVLMTQRTVIYTNDSQTTPPPLVTPTPTPTSSVSFQGNEKTTYDYLTGNIGLNPAAACGVLANIEKESSFNPTVYGDGGTSYGICQWHDNRFTNLKNYCSNHGYDYTSLIGQLHFLKSELEGDYLYILDALRAVDNTGDGAYEAGRVWCVEFERPANSASLSVIRGNLAREKFNSIPNPTPVDDVRMMFILDTIETVGQQLHLAGWVYDKQNTGAQVTLHVYPGEGVQGFSTTGHRPDVNAAYSIDGLHGFDVYIQTSLVGSHEVSLYALFTDGTGAALMYQSSMVYTVDPVPDRTIADGRYIILTSVSDSIELDVAGDTGDIPDGQNVRIWDTTALSQYNSFDITYLSSGYYKIIHAASQKSLDLYYANQENGANIVVHSYNGSDAQLWSITQEGYNGGYVIKSKSSGKVLDIDAGNTTNGTNVQQWELLSTPGQTWRFVPAEHTVCYDANGGSGEPENQTKYYRNDLTLSSSVPVRPGYTFLGWSTSNTAQAAEYEADSTFVLDSNTTLYAVWKADAPTSYIILPDDLITIEERAFEGTGVVYVVLPEGAASIGSKAFADCVKLKHIYIPESVLSIAKDAFSGVPEGMVIHGVDGSYAEFFANKYGFEFVTE